MHAWDAHDAYPPIGDYAVVGDCRAVALISQAGSVDWLCLPDYSSPSVFAALLDRRRGGRFAVGPTELSTVSRRYLGATNVLETVFTARGGGVLRVTDVMPLPSDDALSPMRELLRKVEAVEGPVSARVLFEPRPDYARSAPRLSRRGALGWACSCKDMLLLLQSELPLELTADGTSLVGQVVLSPGQACFLSLTMVRRDIGVILPLGGGAEDRLRFTLSWWESWSRHCTYQGPYEGPVMRSALTLKLLTSALTGAVIAAPTTSLPEIPGGAANWDYRYCWLRDASLTVEAFLGLGYRSEAEAFFDWLLHATRLSKPELQVVYNLYGESRIPETTLDHLRGYRGSRPVRVGNYAHCQFQLDIYGEVVRAAALCANSFGGQLNTEQERLLADFGRFVCRNWRKPDHGIWEIRGERRHYTFSKLLCWVALDCLVRLARRNGPIASARERFGTARTEIREAIETDGFDPVIGSYTGVFGTRELDASLLLMAHHGYLEAHSARMTGTFERIEEELSRNGLVYRYKGRSTVPADLESPFGICAFWAVDYLAQAGRIDEALERFERLLQFANDVGLYGEEIEVETGEPVGNFPQAFTHVGLINAALRLAVADQAGMRRGRRLHLLREFRR